MGQSRRSRRRVRARGLVARAFAFYVIPIPALLVVAIVPHPWHITAALVVGACMVALGAYLDWTMRQYALDLMTAIRDDAAALASGDEATPEGAPQLELN